MIIVLLTHAAITLLVALGVALLVAGERAGDESVPASTGARHD